MGSKIIELCSKKISKIQWKLLKNKNIEKEIEIWKKNGNFGWKKWNLKKKWKFWKKMKFEKKIKIFWKNGNFW